jgi:SET domain-containing protein 6
LEYDAVEPDSTGLLPQSTNVLSSIPEELTTQIKELLKFLRKANPQLNVGPNAGWRIIKRALSTRLAEYPTSIEEDEQLLKMATGRRRMAIEVRLGEKHLMREAEALVDSKIDELSNNSDKGPKPKRQKTS